MDYSQWNGGLIRVDRDKVYYVKDGVLQYVSVLSNDVRNPTMIDGKAFTWNDVQEVDSGAKKPGLLKKAVNFVLSNSNEYKQMKKATVLVDDGGHLSSAVTDIKNQMVNDAPKALLKSLGLAAGVVGAGVGLSMLDKSKAKIDEANQVTAASAAVKSDDLDLLNSAVQQESADASKALTVLPGNSSGTVAGYEDEPWFGQVMPSVSSQMSDQSLLDKFSQLLSKNGSALPGGTTQSQALGSMPDSGSGFTIVLVLLAAFFFLFSGKKK